MTNRKLTSAMRRILAAKVAGTYTYSNQDARCLRAMFYRGLLDQVDYLTERGRAIGERENAKPTCHPPTVE